MRVLFAVTLALLGGAQAQTVGQSCTIANLTPWPVAGSLSDYYICIDGKTQQMTCPAGTLFISSNTQVFGCVPQSQVTCSYNPNNNYYNSYPSNNYYPSSNYYPSNNYPSNNYPSNNYYPSNNNYPSNYYPGSDSYPNNYPLNGYYPNSGIDMPGNNNGYTTVYAPNPNGYGNLPFARNAKPNKRASRK